MADHFLRREDMTDNVIAIKISRSYKEDMTQENLYDVTRGYWKLDIRRAKRADYAICVYKGIIKEVYQIEKWLPAGTVPRSTLPDSEVPQGRYEFVGKIAQENIRTKYIGKSLAKLYRKGEANPIKYFLND